MKVWYCARVVRTREEKSPQVKTIVAALLLSLLPVQAVTQAAQVQPPAPILRAANTTNREVALTFDDGPSAYTPQILSILQRFHVHATFFLVGRLVLPMRAIVREEAGTGDELGNHTYTHADLEWLSRRAILDELEATDSAIQTVTGRRPRWFRPPYGAVSANVSDLARSLGLWTITWSIDPQDWRLPGAGRIASQVIAEARPGSVILLHDGGGNRWQTVAALPIILRSLQARGYRFATLDKLFFPGSRKLHAEQTGGDAESHVGHANLSAAWRSGRRSLAGRGSASGASLRPE